jgi:hypothetical protein
MFIFGGSSIHMRDFTIEDHLTSLPDNKPTAIVLDLADLTIDNMQGNGHDLEPVGPLNVGGSPSTVTIRHSFFSQTAFYIEGHLTIDTCMFRAGGPDVTGGIEMFNSVVVYNNSPRATAEVLLIRAPGNVQSDLDSRITNNTFIGGFIEIRVNPSSSADHHFDGNIFYHQTAIQPATTSIRYDYNLIIPGLNLGGVGNTIGDPLFADPANNNFHLKPGSPAIDAGDPALLSNSHDFDGMARPQGTRSDIGAFEYAP